MPLSENRERTGAQKNEAELTRRRIRIGMEYNARRTCQPLLITLLSSPPLQKKRTEKKSRPHKVGEAESRDVVPCIRQDGGRTTLGDGGNGSKNEGSMLNDYNGWCEVRQTWEKNTTSDKPWKKTPHFWRRGRLPQRSWGAERDPGVLETATPGRHGGPTTIGSRTTGRERPTSTQQEATTPGEAAADPA